MAKLYKNRTNKTEQIARFLFAQGKAMTARQVFEAGFRYEGGEETSPYHISVLLNKLHHSPNYSVERSYVQAGNSRLTLVKVVSIREQPKPGGSVLNEASLNIWRQLLSRKSGQAISGVAA